MESLHWDNSIEYPEHMFPWRNKNNISIIWLEKISYLECTDFYLTTSVLMQEEMRLISWKIFWKAKGFNPKTDTEKFQIASALDYHDLKCLNIHKFDFCLQLG